jgi:hypothetical protein
MRSDPYEARTFSILPLSEAERGQTAWTDIFGITGVRQLTEEIQLVGID